MESLRCLIMVVKTCSSSFSSRSARFSIRLFCSAAFIMRKVDEPQLFFLAHGVDHVFLHLLGQAHGVIIE